MLNSDAYLQSNRPPAMGANGMVASAHPAASAAGLQILMEGGNAADAALATVAALNVVEPYMSGVGGIGVALMYLAGEGRIRVLDFSGRAPGAAEPDRFADDDDRGTGILSCLVPGNVAGWTTIHEAYGSMDRERLFRTAIHYAEHGFPITPFSHRIGRAFAHRLAQYEPSTAIMLDGDGRTPKPGDRLRMPQLADSLRKIAKQGSDVFYTGELAERIVKATQAMDGLLTMDDLAAYRAEWKEPVSIDYRGYRVNTPPPNCSGFQVLQTLKLAEGIENPRPTFEDPDTLHRMLEGTKLCIVDRVQYSGDPDHVEIPLKGLLSDEYAASQRERIQADGVSFLGGERYAKNRPAESLAPGGPPAFDEGGMTTHLAVADREGNVVTITQTLGSGFGSGISIGDTGIFLNNMASYFDIEEGSPNLIGPGKRLEFCVAPTQTTRDGRFFLSMGTPGGHGILQTTPQFLMNVLDHGMNVQQAIEAPRYSVTDGRQVSLEERFPRHVRRRLEDLGHEVRLLDAWAIGGAQGIMADQERGIYYGGGDPRRDGFAVGW